MANWGITTMEDQPYMGTGGVLDLLQQRDLDSATMFLNAPSNPPVGAIRLSRLTGRLEEWDGGNWQGRPISVVGGGTGALDAAGARANLGIGTLGTQAANFAAITGGSITGLNSLQLAGHLTFTAGGQYNIGTSAARAGRVYISGGLVVPVGANKYVPAP